MSKPFYPCPDCGKIHREKPCPECGKHLYKTEFNHKFSAEFYLFIREKSKRAYLMVAEQIDEHSSLEEALEAIKSGEGPFQDYFREEIIENLEESKQKGGE